MTQKIEAKSTFSGIFFPSLGNLLFFIIKIPIKFIFKDIKRTLMTKEEEMEADSMEREERQQKNLQKLLKNKAVRVGFWDILTPWIIIVDAEKKRIITKKRNWHLFNINETTYSYKTIGDVAIKKNIFSSDMAISIYSGESVTPYNIAIYRINKTKAGLIHDLLMNEANFNKN
ncbi:MAG: hypothetical protein PHD97_00655 [Bacteroidales bacterium]|nr:hypothetical protein [Bacteroidales bacterium]